MNVLLVTAEYPPAPCGGIGVFYHGLAHQLAAMGAGVHVVTYNHVAAQDSHGLEGAVYTSRVAFAERRKSFATRAVARARALSVAAARAAVRFLPDVVETHDWAAPLWSPPSRPFLVRLHGAASVLAHARGEKVSRIARLLERRMAAKACTTIAVSDWILRKTQEVFPIDMSRVRVIPNGVDTELFQPRGGARREEIVFAGSLRVNKGVADLLQALEIVLRNRPGACATLAGGPDGWDDLPPRIRALVERVHMAAPGRLRLLGRVDQNALEKLYSRAGVCVFPSHAEAFGLACVEAMSCGAAVIASPLGAGAEIVEHGRSGLLVDPHDRSALASAIERLLADPETAGGLGAEARRRAVERYSIRTTAERTLELYEEAAAGSPWRKRLIS